MTPPALIDLTRTLLLVTLCALMVAALVSTRRPPRRSIGTEFVDTAHARERRVLAAHIEPLTAILRVGGVYGEPYTWLTTLQYDGPHTVIVKGAQRSPTPDEWRAAVAAARAQGITAFRFERRAPGQPSELHEIAICGDESAR
jgi:hypothetical protein